MAADAVDAVDLALLFFFGMVMGVRMMRFLLKLFFRNLLLRGAGMHGFLCRIVGVMMFFSHGCPFFLSS